MKIGSTLNDGKVADRINDEIRRRNSDPRGIIFRTFLQLGLFLALLILTVLLVDVVQNGWGTLSTRFGDFLSGTLRSRSIDEKLGVHQGLVGSFWIAVTTAIVAFPIGIGAAIYLEEYAPKNRLTRFIEINIRNLAGVPSVVYGLLGLFIFVNTFGKWTGGKSLLSAALTLSILVLPIVIITASEAIRATPQSLREGAYGVGATRWEVVRRQVLPYAAPGILTGTLLAMSRAIGEAAPLILVGAVTGRLGTNPGFLDLGALKERFVAMPIVITEWTQNSGRDPGFAGAAAAAIVVLLVFVLALNSIAILLRNRFEKRRK
ncbi:MAG: phosphate ABC transporter, permease protein PstA [Acidimicrobiaceae bacterium]|jgi:phosphate transport system permease protein|nr:phosphate ABC transporter, permease protein PstA [Acidimicrobiaceae bacterium]